MDITEWPQNIHEYHQMLATAEVNAKKLEELQKMAEKKPEEKTETKEEARVLPGLFLNGRIVKFFNSAQRSR